MDELVKKVWGQGRDGVCTSKNNQNFLSNILKPLLHTYPLHVVFKENDH